MSERLEEFADKRVSKNPMIIHIMTDRGNETGNKLLGISVTWFEVKYVNEMSAYLNI